MRFPLSWLRDWVDLPTEISKISELLIKIGVGLESVDDPSVHMANVVVARVVKREKHPKADKLSVCQVFDGSQDLQIVCGAQNYQEGDLVPLAREGAVLPGDFKIKRSKIRDVESWGMLCSSEELGLGKAEDGLMILDPGSIPGTPLASALKLDDPIFALETTANRPDHLSVRGIAREIGALTGKPLKAPTIKIEEKADDPEGPWSLSVEDASDCPLYSARILRGVSVGPSPDWLKKRVEGAGIRSINNVVDVTNFVLVEYGQPLHAFDLGKLEGGILNVRAGKEGEVLETLDRQKRTLSSGDLVIADAKKSVAVAGVMGGAQTEVSDGTMNILVEAAVFDPVKVRRSSRRLNLRSESSLRFERGVDASSTAEALDRAISLMQEVAGGKASRQRPRVSVPAKADRTILASAARIDRLLGSSFGAAKMAALIGSRNFEVIQTGDDLSVKVPSFRPDVVSETDLAEEVAHLAGMEAIPSSHLPEARITDNDGLEWSNGWILRRMLSGFGLREAYTLSFMDPAQASAWGLEGVAPRISNPWSEDMALLRPSLIPNLFRSASDSFERRAKAAALFELGHVFSQANGKMSENCSLAIVISGEKIPQSWGSKPVAFDFYDLKGMAEALASGLGSALRVSAAGAEAPSYLHPGQSARIQINAMSGWMGGLHPALCKEPVFVLELGPWDKKPLASVPRYKPYSRLPFVERDLSCLVEKTFEAGTLLEALRKEGGFSAAQVALKDLFEGAPLPDGKKSLTVSLIYQSIGQTLTDEQVNLRHEELCAKLESILPMEIRR